MVFASQWCYKSGLLKVIGKFNQDIGYKTQSLDSYSWFSCDVIIFQNKKKKN